jgi:hypothetical protein
MDAFEAALTAFIPHRVRHACQIRASGQWHRNRRPGHLSGDKDFAENADIGNWRKLQKEHWESLGVTLFISVYSWLGANAWNDEEGSLAFGDEVTVDGEKCGKDINLNSFWGIVQCMSGQPNTYEVRDAKGEVHVVARRRLRKRVVRKVASIGVTDDLKHDRHSNNHFGEKEKIWLEKFILETFPDDLIGLGPFPSKALSLLPKYY